MKKFWKNYEQLLPLVIQIGNIQRWRKLDKGRCQLIYIKELCYFIWLFGGKNALFERSLLPFLNALETWESKVQDQC